MSNLTYITLYQNEVRAIKIEIRDQYDELWYPSSAYVKFLDEDGNTVINEIPAYVSENTINTIVSSSITATPGKYYLIWRILKKSGSNTYTYYHKTCLVVEEL